MSEYKNNIKGLLASDLKTAIEKLIIDLKEESGRYNELIAISGSFNDISRTARFDIENYDSSIIQIQKIRKRLLDFIDALETKDLKSIRSTFSIKKIPLEIDPEIAKIIINDKYPVDWHQRVLYIESEGAKFWISIMQNPEYINSTKRTEILNCLKEFIKTIKIGSFISLGPGDGSFDRNILASVDTQHINYFPVDISYVLLMKTFTELSSVVNIPIGILSCFESRFTFIAEQLIDRLSNTKIISLLGNTFGNLDKLEYELMKNIESFLEVGDYFLLQVSSKCKDYTIEKDYGAYIKNHSKEMEMFLSNGCCKLIKKSFKEILDAYRNRIFIQTINSDLETTSDVPGVVEINHFEKETNIKILCIRRYDHDLLKDWITKNFSFSIENDRYISYDEKGMGYSCLLLKRIKR